MPALHSVRRDPDRGGLGDPAGAGHEPGFVGGVSAWAEVMSGEGVEREAVLGWWGVAACEASAGDCACALRSAMGRGLELNRRVAGALPTEWRFGSAATSTSSAALAPWTLLGFRPTAAVYALNRERRTEPPRHDHDVTAAPCGRVQLLTDKLRLYAREYFDFCQKPYTA